MDVPVPGVAHAADRQQGRPPRKVDRKLVTDRATQFSAGQRRDEPAKDRAMFQTLDRITAGTADPWEIGDDPAERVAADELVDDDKIERIALERRRLQAVEIEDSQACLRGSAYCNNRVVGCRASLLRTGVGIGARRRVVK